MATQKQQAEQLLNTFKVKLLNCQKRGDQEQAFDLLAEMIEDMACVLGSYTACNQLREDLECWISDNVECGLYDDDPYYDEPIEEIDEDDGDPDEPYWPWY
jgi:hypothetical protein